MAEVLGSLPGSFVGDPCAACPAVRHQLDLYPDQAFVLRTTRRMRNADSVVDRIGSFLFVSDVRTLLLMGGREAPLRLSVEAPDRLRLLDLPGQEVVSQPRDALALMRSFMPVEPRS